MIQSDLVNLTAAQQQAVVARGNVLVMAGAGTGKTKTLVERCLHCLEHNGARLDELLIVTFTEAAAAEMRERLRRAIEDRASAKPGESSAPPDWAEQLARFELAHIGTLHSFCLELVREHFYDLGLDPRLALLDEGEARQFANETIGELFAGHYAGEDEFSLAVQDLIQVHGGGRDESIRRLVLQLHHYSQARPDARGWLARQREAFAAAEPAEWRRWLREAIQEWRNDWLPVLQNLAAPASAAPNEKAAELAKILSTFPEPDSGTGVPPVRFESNGRDARATAKPPSDSGEIGANFSETFLPKPRDAEPESRQTAAELLDRVIRADGNWPLKRKIILRKPLEDLFKEAKFLQSLIAIQNNSDPLAEDWSWVRGQMQTLLRLAEEFAARLAERKRTNSVLDFHDLEQFALELLWDFASGLPTAVAEYWRQKLAFVFVDEYQDINAAQDKIIQGLSREGAAANRFLVGDVKQSIYRFRLAEPRIFREYSRLWRGPAGQTIPLKENFRSHESLLQLANSLFRLLMREEIGGVACDVDAELNFGTPESRADWSIAQNPAPRAELLLRLKNGRDEEPAPSANGDNAEGEARLVAWRLKRLVEDRQPIFDTEQKVFRPVEWRDIAILLRSPRGRSEVFAKEFKRAGIPLDVARGGFYESAEVLDLLSLLQLLDNPLQDLPCVAVLRSPLGGLTLDELAEIRLAAREKHFWTALNRSAELGLQNAETQAKVSRFLQRFSRWRKLARLASLSQCLEEVLAETLYAGWLRTQPRGEERVAGLTAFLNLARRFDQLQRQGLFRFLKFIEAQQEAEAEPEVPATVTGNAVRLMSIHQSKGLEFPVAVLADLAKQFNEQDLRGDIIFDEEYGVCPKVKPPHVGRRYPSLPHWLAQRRGKRELRGEELRLFYVALTRARDYLILTASIPEKQWLAKWLQPRPAATHHIAAAKCAADWLALWFSNQSPAQTAPDQSSGAFPFLRWQLISDAKLPEALSAGGQADAAVAGGQTKSPVFVAADELAQLRARLEWSYPHQAATRYKAKSSVTALRREAEEFRDEEAELIVPASAEPPAQRRTKRPSSLSAAEIGAAHHKFLEHLALDQAGDLAAEAGRLVRENYLSPEERAALDLASLAAFWTSTIGREILAHGGEVRRELPFTARFSPVEIAQITGAKINPQLAEEYVIVQGVADLVVLRPDEIWLVDFKTDQLKPRELPEKISLYTPQLRLYALALERIFPRKVTLRALHFLALGRTEEV